MALSYLAPDGTPIGYEAWQEFLADPTINGYKEDIIEKGDFDICLKKKYSGNAVRLFTVSIECDKSLDLYYGYRFGAIDPEVAELEYQRVKLAIQNDEVL